MPVVEDDDHEADNDRWRLPGRQTQRNLHLIHTGHCGRLRGVSRYRGKFSRLLTLYTTPVVHLYLDRLGGWMQRLMRGTKKPNANNASCGFHSAGNCESV
jgi:hypothetical protein